MTRPKPNILIIDDDPLSLELLIVLLAAESYTVQSASSGDEAIHLLQHSANPQPPAIILADLQMPGLCGNPLALALRKVIPASTRLLAISATQPNHTITEHYDAFLLKPFSPEDLEEAIQRLVSPEAPNRSDAPSHAKPEQAAILDEAILTRLQSAMSPQQLTELYSFCLTDARAGLTRMAQHLDQRDDPSFRARAHAIKGSCGMLGATEMRACATELEDTGIEGRTTAEVHMLLEDFRAACDRLDRAFKARISTA